MVIQQNSAFKKYVLWLDLLLKYSWFAMLALGVQHSIDF